MDAVELAENIRKFRVNKGWSKSKLAREVSLHNKTIGAYESGEVEPGALKLKQIANCLDVTPNILLGVEPKSNIPKEQKETLNEKIVEIVNSLFDMSLTDSVEVLELTSLLTDNEQRHAIKTLIKGKS